MGVKKEGVLEFTDAQAITAAGALGAMLLMVFERNMDPKKLVTRKIKKVEEAILDLYRGTGAEIDRDVANLMIETWDQTMKTLAGRPMADKTTEV